MTDMVFQCTVLGPPLWNLFFSDARRAISAAGFAELIYADDLNTCRVMDRECSNAAAFGLTRN
eukprot:1725715-Alexandrium_andersonii.AAC.1